VAGVASFLADQRIDVVETGTSLPVITDIDLVLYDSFGQVDGKGIDLADFVRDGGAKVVVYSWNLRPDLIQDAIEAGACGYLSKVLTGPVIVGALERILNGEIVIMAGDHETSVGGAGDWPGRAAGLSSREAEIIALITRGLTNQEIADRAYVSMNTVKSYIRSAYRRIGVQRRTQAVLWAVANGFEPDTERIPRSGCAPDARAEARRTDRLTCVGCGSFAVSLVSRRAQSALLNQWGWGGVARPLVSRRR
jgi:DNA-binding NarL/FixJ family response regulator